MTTQEDGEESLSVLSASVKCHCRIYMITYHHYQTSLISLMQTASHADAQGTLHRLHNTQQTLNFDVKL